jgi:membrane-associated phospholipid phosphatase
MYSGMMRGSAIAISVACAVASGSAFASSKVETAGTGLAIAMPVIAGGISIYKDDWTGVAEMSVDTVLTVGTTYGLSHYVVREQRPDHSDFHAFPSNTEALAFAPAAFLWDRYGWTYGVPAYAAAAFVGYSRVDARQHHWYDVAASAAIGWTYSEIITTRYRLNDRVSTGAFVTPHGGMAYLAYRW